jgi:hypothetical protein
MAVTILDRNDPRFPQGGPDPEADNLHRQRLSHAKKKDEREEFIKETVKIAVGPKATMSEVILRYPRSVHYIDTKDEDDIVIKRDRVWTNGRYVFAVYSDNVPWHGVSRDEWEAGARNAVEKFCAIHNASIKFGPRQEDTNRYNIMAEVSEPIEVAK